MAHQPAECEPPSSASGTSVTGVLRGWARVVTPHLLFRGISGHSQTTIMAMVSTTPTPVSQNWLSSSPMKITARARVRKKGTRLSCGICITDSGRASTVVVPRVSWWKASVRSVVSSCVRPALSRLVHRGVRLFTTGICSKL